LTRQRRLADCRRAIRNFRSNCAHTETLVSPQFWPSQAQHHVPQSLMCCAGMPAVLHVSIFTAGIGRSNLKASSRKCQTGPVAAGKAKIGTRATFVDVSLLTQFNILITSQEFPLYKFLYKFFTQFFLYKFLFASDSNTVAY